MATESAAAPANGVPIVKAPLGATPKPVGELVNLSKRGIDNSEFFADIPPDELLAAMSDGDEPDPPRRTRPKLESESGSKKPARREPEPEPEPDEDDEPLATEEDEKPSEAEEEQEPPEEPESKAWSVPEGKGTKDAPLSLKDLPEELFVELPVNGEKQVVDLKEAGKGYMRRQAFDQQVSKVKQGLADAHDIAEKAVSAQERTKQHLDQTRQGFEAFIKDPKRVLAALFDQVPDKRRIVEALVEDHEDAYEELSVAYAEFRNRENALRENGYQQGRQNRAREREQRRYQREQAALDAERRQIAEDRQRWEQEQAEKTRTAQETERQKAAAQAAFVALKPGLDAGLLALGLTELSDEMRHEVQVRLGVTKRIKGTALTSDDVKQAVIRAGKVLGIEPGAAKRPAPVRTGATPSKSAPRRTDTSPKTGRDFDSMPANRRVRDLEWYLNG